MNDGEIIIDREEEQLLGQFVGNSLASTMKSMNQLTKRENVAIFIDYDNVHIGFKEKWQTTPDSKDPEKNLFLQLWKIYDRNNVRTFRAYADFELLKSDLTSLQEKRIQVRHVYSKSGANNRKNSSDIEMCLDAIETTYKDSNISTYVIVTGDRDMIPLLSRLMYKGKQVELFYIGGRSSETLQNYAHHSFEIGKFLNLQEVSFNPENHVYNALGYVQIWHSRNATFADRWLGIDGKRGLKEQFSQRLGITPQNASDLIAHLTSNAYAAIAFKETSQGSKNELVLTERGSAFIESQSSRNEAVTS
jgi:uncharacterized LabA/DUF88 family protein